MTEAARIIPFYLLSVFETNSILTISVMETAAYRGISVAGYRFW